MTEQYDALRFDLTEGVATVTLHRPEVHNALDRRMAQELMEVSIRCDEDPAVRAVVLTGAGDKAFCAGGDLASFHREGDRVPVLIKEVTTYLHAAVSRFARMKAPVIGAVNGVAAGAGFSLAASVDLAIAAEGARFLSAYTAAGLTPDGSSTYFVPRLIGVRRYLELALTNRTLSAAEALDWGLVNRVVPASDLAAEARETALRLAHGPTLAYGGVKRLVQWSMGETLESQMELESREIADRFRTADAREGVEAFLQKRKPQFTGR